MAPKKQRLDKLLVDRNLVPSRERARALILAGKVKIENRVADKAGQLVSADVKVTLDSPEHPFVSRGGIKLQHALESFKVDVSGKVAIDVGASTGGFTDCLLQAGAVRIFAVDVGYGQFDFRLRNDERVTLLERCNVRYLDPNLIEPVPDLAVIDVSFISLEKVIPQVMKIMRDRGEIIALIKPQFEVGKGKVGKGGVVKNSELHQGVIEKIKSFSENQGLRVAGITASPIDGPKGNKEFFIHLLIGK